LLQEASRSNEAQALAGCGQSAAAPAAEHETAGLVARQRGFAAMRAIGRRRGNLAVGAAGPRVFF